MTAVGDEGEQTAPLLFSPNPLASHAHGKNTPGSRGLELLCHQQQRHDLDTP